MLKMQLRKIGQIDVYQKTVLLRLDLNLPNKAGKFSDTSRITSALETLNYLRSQSAKIVIISHMGRPKGEFNRTYSLAPVVDELEKHLKCKVKFATDCIGEKVKRKVSELKIGEILLLENLRFHAGEEKNDPSFAKELASLGQVFINEAFSCSHRQHASIVAVTKLLPAAAGFALIKEIENLQSYLNHPQSLFMAIVGGSKISSKIDLLYSLVHKTDILALGGAMANTFLHAQGFSLGRSMIEENMAQIALDIIELSKKQQKTLLLPQDFIVENEQGKIYLRSASQIKPNEAIMDLGPISSAIIAKFVHQSKTLIWNGPLGAFEQEPFNCTSLELVRNIASATVNSNLNSVAGGGDTMALLKSSGMNDAIRYISTGGGAFLHWLEGKTLPGIKALDV